MFHHQIFFKADMFIGDSAPALTSVVPEVNIQTRNHDIKGII